MRTRATSTWGRRERNEKQDGGYYQSVVSKCYCVVKIQLYILFINQNDLSETGSYHVAAIFLVSKLTLSALNTRDTLFSLLGI
jgi:hypothetical protein